MEGTLHTYHPARHLPLFAYSHPPPTPTPNVLLFIGGMFDTFLSPTYISSLATLLSHAPTWSVIHLQLSSSNRQFGTSSLDKDVSEITTGINFIRSTPTLGTPTTKIVLIGHSTGCQDVMHYITSPLPTPNSTVPVVRPPIHGAILQAPVSDRDSLNHTINTSPTASSHYSTCISICNSTPPSSHRTTLLPSPATFHLVGPVPLSIERFLSLASPTSPTHPSADDKFSFDATPEALSQTFGRVGAEDSPLQPLPNKTPPHPSILILISNSDEYIPTPLHHSLPSILSKWRTALTTSPTPSSLHPSSGIIPHGLHDLSGSDITQQYARLVDMRGRVLRYLDDVENQGVGEACWSTYRQEAQSLEDDLNGVSEAVSGLKL